MTSVLVPVLYVVVLVGSLYIFSQFYRKRAAARLQQDPWWPVHPERDVYITLLQQTDPPAPEYILKAALLRRAVADITRIQSMREDKQAATVLVQKGSVGDDLLGRLQAAEKELETEILEVVGEANSFKEGWGSYIFQTAIELLANEKLKELYASLPQLKAETALKYNRQKKAKTTESPASPAVTSPSVASPPPVVPKSDTLAPPPMPQQAGTSDAEEQTTTPLSPNSRTKKGKKRK